MSKPLLAVAILPAMILFSGCSNPLSSKNNLSQIQEQPNEQQTSDPDPSERAITVAARVFLWLTEGSQQDFFNKYSSGEQNPKIAIRHFAQYLDNNPEQLILDEELLEKYGVKDKANATAITPMQTPQPTNQAAESALEKITHERQQECQDDLAKYNSCISLYSTKLAEYNACLTEAANPTSWRYGTYCTKPLNTCVKPLCAY